MANSRKPGPEKGSLIGGVLPAGTPGSLGRNDAADPNSTAMFGDTPGSIGINDYAANVATIPVIFTPLALGVNGFLQMTVDGTTIQGNPVIKLPFDQKPTTAGDSPMISWGKKVSKDFKSKVIAIAGRLGIEADQLMAVMAFESGETFSASVKNKESGAVGLIQFTDPAATAVGTTRDALAKMTAEEQLRYVEQYLAPFKGRLRNLGDVYLAVLLPAGVGQSDDYIVFDKNGKHPLFYEQNKGLDKNNDGKVTRAEAVAPVAAKLKKGKTPPYYG